MVRGMTRLPTPAAVIFDMDGLLFDTECLYRDAILEVAGALGIALTEETYLQTIGMSQTATRAFFTDQFGANFKFDEFWSAAAERFNHAAADGVALKPGVRELLDYLHVQRIPCGIATSSHHHDAARHLAVHDLSDRFDCIVAHGDYTRGKPHPDPYLMAAERLEKAPNVCLALEDSHNGVRAASAAGMITVMVPDLISPTPESRDLCALVADNLHQVLDRLPQTGLSA